MITALIVDDDRNSVDILARGLADLADVKLLATASDLDEGLALAAELKPDILFLDIEFPGESAVDRFSESLTASNSHIVFYSSYQKYLLKALRLRVFDFLLKPFDPTDLQLILHRFRLHKEGLLREQVVARVGDISTELAANRKIAITTVTNDRVIVSPADILYFRYDGNRKIWEAVLNTLERYILKRHSTADNIVNYGPDFVRTHKAYIVNVAYLGMLTATGCKLLPPFDHITEIKISKSYRRELLDRFYDI